MATMSSMPSCCVAMVMHAFQASYAGFGKDTYLKQLAATVRDARNMGYSLDRLAVVVAYTTTAQNLANECLPEMGFENTKVLPKAKHPETDLNCWMVPAPALYTWAIEYLKKFEKPKPPVAVIEWSEDYTLETL